MFSQTSTKERKVTDAEVLDVVEVLLEQVVNHSQILKVIKDLRK